MGVRTARKLTWALALLALSCLSVGSTAALARSYCRFESITFFTRHGRHVAFYDRGICTFVTEPYAADLEGPFEIDRVDHARLDASPSVPPGDDRAAVFGFHTGHFFIGMPDDAWWISFPIWYATVLFGILPVVAASFMAARRNSAGHCRVCGYDLRATRLRCPECGAVFGKNVLQTPPQ
jgi:hypothetical protein